MTQDPNLAASNAQLKWVGVEIVLHFENVTLVKGVDVVRLHLS